MNIGLSCRWLRVVFCVLMAFGGTGCASTPAVPENGTQWRQVPSVPGCVSATSQWDLAEEINIRLQPELQAVLMEQLEQQSLEAPLCWYKIPSGDLLLRAGNFCGLSQEAEFHRDGLRWALVRVEHVLGECGSKR